MPVSTPASHAPHECWWSRNRLCELRWDQNAISGSGIDLHVLEAACADLSGCLILEPQSEDDTRLQMVLPGQPAVNGHLHDDCFFHLKSPPESLGHAVIRFVLEYLVLRHTGLRVDLASVSPGIAGAIREAGPLRFRAEPAAAKISIEARRRTWPLGAKRFRERGSIRFEHGRPTADLSLFTGGR